MKIWVFGLFCLYSLAICGRETDPIKKNAFLHPNDPDAEFPQDHPPEIVDLRSAKLNGGTEFIGALRKNAKRKKNAPIIRLAGEAFPDEDMGEEENEYEEAQEVYPQVEKEVNGEEFLSEFSNLAIGKKKQRPQQTKTERPGRKITKKKPSRSSKIIKF